MSFIPKTIIFMGPIGSGKGTQAKLLAEKTDFKVFSTGAHYRKLSKQNTPMAKHVAEAIDGGGLMHEWFHTYVIQDYIYNLDPNEGVILDSVAKKPGEAELLENAFSWIDRDYVVVYFDVSEDEIKRRIAERFKQEGRKDDRPESVIERLERYQEETMLSIAFFKKQGRLITINAEQTPEAVHAELLKALA